MDSQEVGPTLHRYLSGITRGSRNYPVEILEASSPRVQGLAQGEMGLLWESKFPPVTIPQNVTLTSQWPELERD